ncbi:ABC transporter ATP-binding protein, partial [Chloroflexota bacterium]
FNVGNQVGEATAAHQRLSRKVRDERVVSILRKVEIPSPEVRIHDFPHQLSGGMRQRVVGAIAFSCEPQVLIADEPTTSLDVTVQLQYLKLLKDVQAQTRLAILFITHDFGVVANVCDRVVVMYAGRIVEMGTVREIFNSPLHPYTKALMRSIPDLDEKTQTLGFIEGEPPALHHMPQGCVFRPRCLEHGDVCCDNEYPPQRQVGPGHLVSCWRTP